MRESRPFQTEQKTDGQTVRCILFGVLPERNVAFQIFQRTNGGHFPSLFHGPIPSQLRLRHGPCLRGRTPARNRNVSIVLFYSRNLRGYDKTNATAAQFGHANSATSPARLVFQSCFA